MPLTVDYRRVGDLVRYEKNARTHTPAQVEQIATSIREFGWTNPVLLDEAGVVIAGHGRLDAAVALGMDEVPTITLAGLTDAQKRVLRIADNQLALNAGWDLDVLSAEVAAISDGGFDISLLGFDDEYIAGLLRPAPAAGGGAAAEDDGGAEQVDRADELQKKWGTALGQLWLIPSKTAPPERQVTCPHCGHEQEARWAMRCKHCGGEFAADPRPAHRLACADSRDPAVLARLLGGRRAHAVMTSPPFLQQRTYGGAMADDWEALMEGVFGAVLPALAEDAQVFVNLGLVHHERRVIRYWEPWLDWMAKQGWPLFAWYVWHKPSPVPGEYAGRLVPAHEWLFHFAREGRKVRKTEACKYAGSTFGSAALNQWDADGTKRRFTHAGRPMQDTKVHGSVLSIEPAKGSSGAEVLHPARFPTALPAFFMEAWPLPLWLDPFCGSGSTILAAERSATIGAGVELSPAYAAVVLERLALAGLEPRKVEAA